MSPASSRSSAPPRGLVVALGASLAMASLLGVVHQVRALDAAETSVVLTDVSASTWRGTRRTFDPFTLRAGDVLRVTACPAAAGDPHLRLTAVAPSGAPALDLPLTAAASDALRCVGLRWTAPRPLSLRAALVAAAPAPPLRRLSLFAGPLLRTALTWPLLALVAALALLVLAPSLSQPALRREPSLRSTFFLPVIERPGGLPALAGAFVLCEALPSALLGLLGVSPLTMLLALLAQNAGFVLAAAWLLGGLSPDGPPLRTALGLERTGARWLLLAPPLAAALLALAKVTSHWITDTSQTPLAHELASTPLRLALLFTALLAPLSEELFYRQAVLRALRWAGPTGAVLLQAAVFTALHVPQLRGALWGLLPIAAVGLTNGWLRRASGGVAAPWLVHSIYNGALIGSMLLGPQ